MDSADRMTDKDGCVPQCTVNSEKCYTESEMQPIYFTKLNNSPVPG
jgi:hypothetical protein